MPRNEREGMIFGGNFARSMDSYPPRIARWCLRADRSFVAPPIGKDRNPSR